MTTPNGLKPIPSNARVRDYVVAPGDGRTYAVGDPVALLGGSYSGPVMGGGSVSHLPLVGRWTSGPMLGAITEVRPADRGLYVTEAAAARTEYVHVRVCDDPAAEFEVVCNNADTLSSAAVGMQFDLVPADASSALSGAYLNVSLPGSAARITRVVDAGIGARVRVAVPVVLGQGGGGGGGASSAGNTVYTIGDSFAALGYGTVSNNYVAMQSEGVFNWVNWLLGGTFNLLANTAVGGKTARQMIDEQFPAVLAARPKYAWMSCGHNDLYNDAVSEQVVYSRMIEALSTLQNAGITPIWTTVWHRSFDAAVTARHVRLNDMLRRYAYLQGGGSIFWDGAAITNDPASANNEGRLPLSGWYYDSNIHPNNLHAMRIGQFAAAVIGPRVSAVSPTSVGNETVAIATAGSNLLDNPSFQGTSGTVSANCTGTMPAGWVIDWATRTGTGTAAAAIVNIADPTTGLTIARGVQVTIGGTPASGDVLRVSQSNAQNAALASGLSGGDVMQAEGMISLASSAAVTQVAMRVQANTNESTWAGVASQSAAALPATVPPLTYRTAPLAVLGSGAASQARYDLRMTFNGNGSGTVLTLWKPRVRKLA